LSEDSQDRLERNPLRILDSKDPRDKAFLADAPKIDTFLSGEAQEFFGKVCEGLGAAGVTWQRAESLVRGLDYYRHTAFEFVTDRLGAQGTVLGGGRYDGLIEALGGPSTPAVGWAAGIERLAMLVADAGAITEPGLTAMLAVEDDAALAFAQKVITAMRFQGIDAEMIATGSPRKRFDKAVKSGAKAIVSFGIKDGVPTASLRSGDTTPARLAVEQVLQSVHP
jgi:histidyl-tRNA synthetase